jgi:hypothetical protein
MLSNNFRIAPIIYDLRNQLIPVAFLITYTIDSSKSFVDLDRVIVLSSWIYSHFCRYLLYKLGLRSHILGLLAQIWKEVWLRKLMRRGHLFLNAYLSLRRNRHFLELFDILKFNHGALRSDKIFCLVLFFIWVFCKLKSWVFVLALLSAVRVIAKAHVLNIFQGWFCGEKSRGIVGHQNKLK